MKRWFGRLPVHRKLVAMALFVSTAALLTASLGLMVLDVGLYRVNAQRDTAALARIVADNSAAAVAFSDPGAAEQTLSSLRAQGPVTRACIYLLDGTLFAGYARETGGICPEGPAETESLARFGALVPIAQGGAPWGWVYVERDLSDLGARLAVTAAAAAGMLLLAAALAFALAQRLTRSVSGPIAALAAAARRVGHDLHYPVPSLEAAEDEVGDLVRSFEAMMVRIRNTNADLHHEIHERKQIEAERERLLVREREASRLKDEFLAAVSHELRTPLNAIYGWVQVLATAKPDPEVSARAIASIARNVHAQTRVIEDLVDVSRIVTGKLHLEFEAVDLRGPVGAAIDVARPGAQAKGIRITVHAPAERCLVWGDRDRLQQIVLNLLSNAVKFTGVAGQVTVAVEAHQGAYELSVKDNGIGMSPEFLACAFDRFRQADGSMKREHGGLGLGLAIVKDLTEMHGGSVHAASAGIGHGATFSVLLPALTGEPDAAADATAVHGGPATATLAGVRVLVVDDNPDALELMATTLQAAGATVRTLGSGRAAVEAWDRDPADVVLCDLAMPGLNGFDVLREIRARDAAAGRTTRAIAVSAHATPEYRERSLEAGFAQYLAKPYRIADLLRAIKGLVPTSPGWMT
jgi:signal transduction histidine kinase/ActR/RegA family two-component response regulator